MDSRIALFFAFWGSMLISTVAVLIYLVATGDEWLFIAFCHPDSNHLTRIRWNLTVVSNSISLMSEDTFQIFPGHLNFLHWEVCLIHRLVYWSDDLSFCWILDLHIDCGHQLPTKYIVGKCFCNSLENGKCHFVGSFLSAEFFLAVWKLLKFRSTPLASYDYFPSWQNPLHKILAYAYIWRCFPCYPISDLQVL